MARRLGNRAGNGLRDPNAPSTDDLPSPKRLKFPSYSRSQLPVADSDFPDERSHRPALNCWTKPDATRTHERDVSKHLDQVFLVFP
jgi:hypothetical protein